MGRGRLTWGTLVLGLLAGAACGESDQDPGSPGSGGVAGVAGSAALGGQTGSAGHSGSNSLGGAGTAASGGTSSGASGTLSGGAPVSGAGGEVGSAGSSDSGGDAGAAGAGADLVVVGSIPADKIDLLFVIDDSISMADKQQIFKSAVPLLVKRLVTPVCLDATGAPNGQHAGTDGVCALGEPEFQPIRDIHIGVITSSLGGHGGQVCTTPEDDDKAHLLGKIQPELRSWNDSGFLAWDPDGTRNTPAGESNADTLVSDFTDMVVQAGESGCGFEAPLEAWYRFLIDPDPPSLVAARADLSGVDVTYPDSVVLEQRQAFLRPDSLVGIAVLTDENDCSISDGGQSFLVGLQNVSGQTFYMPRATSACATDPNDPCCTSCKAVPPSGCPAPSEDKECAKGDSTQLEDHVNLRCYEQKRRFGFDLLEPIERYVRGLTQPLVPNRVGELVANPLFQAPYGTLARDASKVFLLQIVGVPWQDLADEESLSDARRLRYLSFEELEARDRWQLLLGDSVNPPGDALMLETSQDRSTLGFGPHPITGAVLAPPSSSPTQNPINGHESSINDGSDLQYACIFPLATPRDCSTDPNAACDCDAYSQIYSRVLCQHPDGGPSSFTQYFAKAYPSLRQIELARDFGRLTRNSALASICPKVLDSSMPSTDANYGYNPAVTALVDRMKAQLAPACLAKSLETGAGGGLACKVLEASEEAPCTCAGAGRSTPSAELASSLRTRLATSGSCDASGRPSCDSLCVCEIEQVPAESLAPCQADLAAPADLAGFCYLDLSRGVGNATLLQHCPSDRKRRLRFLGDDIPKTNANIYVLCP